MQSWKTSPNLVPWKLPRWQRNTPHLTTESTTNPTSSEEVPVVVHSRTSNLGNYQFPHESAGQRPTTLMQNDPTNPTSSEEIPVVVHGRTSNLFPHESAGQRLTTMTKNESIKKISSYTSRRRCESFLCFHTPHRFARNRLEVPIPSTATFYLMAGQTHRCSLWYPRLARCVVCLLFFRSFLVVPPFAVVFGI